ncbi:MAG: alpha-glucan family phosphorylase [Candidatus Methylacidiphilales bacterium]|nr:alpha-glucan family phosphorylase [Candidatus Methylacidiphilales bacterium]
MAHWPHSFSVIPQLPTRIEPLRELAYNLWWTWNDKAISLFRRLDPKLWEDVGHNPARLLRDIRQIALKAAAENPDFVSHLDEVTDELQAYLGKNDRWYRKTYGSERDSNNLVAYFSAEFGFHESLPIYSGGLGILAGDHCKAASDLGVPFIAVGLLYRLGYFKQRINKDGWQESESIHWKFEELPISEVRTGEAQLPLTVTVLLPGRNVYVKVWEVKIGLIRLYLMDTDVPENSEDDRKITYQLYGGDHEMRVKQEIVLGIGGARAIAAMGLKPAVYHMNEGHAAFLSLERVRVGVVDHGLKFSEALQYVAASSLFTTHTPVAAGNDAFSPDLVNRYFGSMVHELKITQDEFLRLGRSWEARPDEPFSMTILALRTSRQANGVSAIHGDVSRKMWQVVWPGVPAPEIPIDHITNGIHTLTWMAPEIRALFEKAGGAFWEDSLSSRESWKSQARISDEDFWSTHQALKNKLIGFARANLRNQRLRSGFSAEDIRLAGEVLEPNILTIGFARRFATYKRATLLFRDLHRLDAIVNNPDRPVQFLFAGKAHPADEPGKRLIQRIYQVAQMPQFRDRILFIENYDINVARYMYHGVDVWMNNPTRPLEASGTSGEKVPPNGGLNFSVRDGWWDEAYDGTNGWAIGEEVTSSDPNIQDEFDAVSIYSLLEERVAPLYYNRDSNGIPKEWLKWCRDSIETVSPVYNTFRMVQDYTTKFYRSAATHGRDFQADGFARSRGIAAWKEKIRALWPNVRAKEVFWKVSNTTKVSVGEAFKVDAKVYLGQLGTDDVRVEAYIRSTSGRDQFYTFELEPTGLTPEGWTQFSGAVRAIDSGSFQFNVRVLPRHLDLIQKHELRLTTWAE